MRMTPHVPRMRVHTSSPTRLCRIDCTTKRKALQWANTSDNCQFVHRAFVADRNKADFLHSITFRQCCPYTLDNVRTWKSAPFVYSYHNLLFTRSFKYLPPAWITTQMSWAEPPRPILQILCLLAFPLVWQLPACSMSYDPHRSSVSVRIQLSHHSLIITFVSQTDIYFLKCVLFKTATCEISAVALLQHQQDVLKMQSPSLETSFFVYLLARW